MCEHFFINLKKTEPRFVFIVVGKEGHRQNYEDPFNKIFKILDVRSISSRKHELGIW